MATMVKEKRREKKKTKAKTAPRSSLEREQPSILNEPEGLEDTPTSSKVIHSDVSGPSENAVNQYRNTIEPIEANADTLEPQTGLGYQEDHNKVSLTDQTLNIEQTTTENKLVTLSETDTRINKEISNISEVILVEKDAKLLGNTYQDLNTRLERISIPGLNQNQNLEDIKNRLENPQAYLKLDEDAKQQERSEEVVRLQSNEMVMDAMPSAPVFEEEEPTQYIQHNEYIFTETQRPKVQSMPIEEAVKLYGGTEMERVKAWSEKEEAIVEAGPISGPQHPLVDLLSTLRSSLIAVDRERLQLSKGYKDEEKFRKSLWKVETRLAEGSEECSHGSRVSACVKFEHAEFLKEKLPVAKLKLEGLLRDVQDSYCHHQHTALLTHCQIEELFSETIRSNKKEMREALALVLKALRLSDNAPTALAIALQRWAAVLSAALLDGRDINQLLHLLHHLFRQTRSVRWASRVIRSYIRAGDRIEAAQAIAVLDLLLAKAKVESAVECTEDADDTWEEIDKSGSGAVCEGSLRERDILALLRSFPLRDLVSRIVLFPHSVVDIPSNFNTDKSGSGAVCEGSLKERDTLALLRSFPLRDLVSRIVLFPHSDVSQAREYEWGDRSGGSGVLKACCGVRTLLNTLQRGISSHPTYTKLHAQLKNLAVHTLHALAELHLHSREYYTTELEQKVTAELEACFCAGFNLLGAQQLQEPPATLLAILPATLLATLPATLLANHTAREYCCVNILALHDKAPKQLDFVPITLPISSCKSRVKTITQVALDRLNDHELAKNVMEFLFQTGIKRRPVSCRDGCEMTARESLPRFLHVHPNLHTLALHTLAEYYQVDPLEPSSITPLAPQAWRPSPGEVQHLLEDWRSRCPHLVQHLLLRMDYTPHSGLSLETQLTIGSWLCSWLRTDPKRPPPPEWAWSVLRRMRVHRTFWGAWSEAPPPDPTPDDLFSMAFAVLSSTWGHCIPLICSEGVDALCKLATVRAGDACHCLAPLMLIMAHSPESVALTPKFTELFNTLLKAGPTMVQRALGLGPEPGADVLLRLILNQVEGNHPGTSRSSLISAWLHALWKPSLPACAQLDTLLLATRDWAAFDAHVNQLLQDKSASEVVNTAVRNVSTAPMLCSCVLRGLLAVQSSRGVFSRVCQVIHVQRTVGDRIHVDNALKHIGANMSAEDLVIYKCASALLCAPAQRPAHLALWALFYHLYLQRPPESMTDTTSPCGPLFFSGLIKSRVLAQLRKKLQETITYHQNEVTTLKQNHREETPQAPSRSKNTKKNVTEDGVLPMLNIRDLSGESSESSESDSENSEESEREETSYDFVEKKEDLAMLLKYHNAAESMCKEYLRWLDEGNNTRAMPHHADIARFIPEQVLAAAWSRELVSRRPPPLPEETSPPATPTTPRASPFQSAVARILSIKDCSSNRSRRLSIKSPLEDMDCRDPRTLLKLVDKHLANMEALAEEWCTEVARLASLDSALWELVAQLRVSRALPPLRKSCAHADCEPVTIHVQAYEWCISLGAETGIDKNRQTARSLTRRVARPRPHAARSAAALVTIARHVASGEVALRVVERAWQCARAVHTCAPAQTAITALVELLADKWLAHNGAICSSLLARWGGSCSSPLQRALCGALVAPRRLPAPQCVPLYRAVLHAALPPHIAFSFLSKFELSRWVQVAEPPQRRELLEALLAAAQRWGIAPAEDCHVLLELIGVHTTTLLSAQELSAHITRCALASTAGALPPAYWPHVTQGVETHASHVPFDQIGHLLRELGVLWWEARSGLKGAHSQRKVQHGVYAEPTADLLHALSRAFTAAAVKLSYSPERVALYVWSALQESWSPWVSPAPSAPPMLTAHRHTDVVRRLVGTIRRLMLDCPGIEEHLLARIFEYTVQTFCSCSSSGLAQECRVQLSSLLEEFHSLPWSEHQWFQSSSLQPALQACASNSKEIQQWCSDTWREVTAATWLRGATDEHVSPLLASLLYLFTAMTQHTNTLEQASRLPWWRLPQAALEEALERFFVQHHNPTLPYDDLPQFKVLLFASELRISPSAPPPVMHSAGARHKRATAISRWVLSACAPALSEHVTSQAAYLLQTVTEIAPYLEGSEGEIEELLGRAVAVMCIEPAASAALPVWCEWVSSAPPRLVAACVSAASILTAFEYFAALADVSIRAHQDNTQCGDWPAVYGRLSPSPWREAAALLARTRLYAAYAVLHAHAHAHMHANVQTALLALLAADVNYIENEAIVSVWICVACRVALSYPEGSGGAECGAAARALLARLAEQRARSLLKMVTLQADTNTPTQRHRLLACLALCIVSPSESAAKAYEAACTAILGSSPDVLPWGRAPTPKQLPRLATRLFPNHEKYFKHELDLASEKDS